MQNMKLERFRHHIVAGRGIHIRHYLIKGSGAALHRGVCTLLAAARRSKKPKTTYTCRGALSWKSPLIVYKK